MPVFLYWNVTNAGSGFRNSRQHEWHFLHTLIPLQIRPGWGRAPAQPQFVQLQARPPGAGRGGRGSGGRRWGGGGRQPDREVSRRGARVPVSCHNRSVWGGRGGGRDGDGSISYELWTHSQVFILSTGHGYVLRGTGRSREGRDLLHSKVSV